MNVIFHKFSLLLRYTFSALISCMLVIIGPGSFTASAQTSPAPATSPLLRPEDTRNGDLPWVLHADKLISLNDGIIVEAYGEVVLTRGSDYLKADFARMYTSTNWVFVQGNVQVRLGQDELTASEAEFDLSSSTGWLKNGHIFMEGPHIYFTGESVTKHWGDSYTFENAKVTACDDPVPAWSLSARSATVEVDGYATLTRSTFQVMDKGIFFAPFMVLPAKTTRQTGLLAPDIGASNQHGMYYTQPWFWAINQDRDLTLYTTWMENIGVMPSLEYRSKTTDKSQTWLGLDMLYDSDTINHSIHSLYDSNLGLKRTNHLRYWLRGMSEGELAQSNWFYKFNLDYVSDQDFLREFKNRMTGFERSRQSMVDLFGRDIQNADENRVSAGYLYRDWERFRLSAGMRYEQNPVLGHGNAGLSSDTTAQRLPQLSAFLFKGRLLKDLPLELEASAETAYMYRRTGASGLRSEIYPRLSLPLNLRHGTIIATGGLRQTMYHNTQERAVSPLQIGDFSSRTYRQQDSQYGSNRTLPDFNLVAFTQANRVWNFQPKPLEAIPENVGKSRWTGLQHIFQPRMEYNWVANVGQRRNPFYTLDDRINPSNALYLTLTNLFTVRRESVLPDPTPEGGSAPASASLVPDYQELLRIRLGGGFDFEEAQRSRHIESYERQPMMDLMGDINLQVAPWVGLWSRTYVSMYGKGITRSDHGLNFTNARWGDWSVSYSNRAREYDYLRQVQYENTEDIDFNTKLNLINQAIQLRPHPNWSLGVISSYNLETGDQYETGISLSFIHQCYRLTGTFLASGRERSYQFNIELLGFN